MLYPQNVTLGLQNNTNKLNESGYIELNSHHKGSKLWIIKTETTKRPCFSCFLEECLHTTNKLKNNVTPCN